MMTSAPEASRIGDLDSVTFEVLKNAFRTGVDEMAEQVLRTCYSFVLYSKDFSSAICDRYGNTVMQGSYDIAVHVGTLHFTAKAVLDKFEGNIFPGDVFVMNDPYIGGTHLNDVRFVRPIFEKDELVAMVQCNGHWADVGGSVPGSHDITARESFAEGVRITPLKIIERDEFRADVADMIFANTRTPVDCEGDLHAQIAATRVGESEIHRLIGKYGKDTVLAGFEAVQDYVETIVRKRISELPDGEWHAEDHIDFDPGGASEGLIPVKVKMTISGDELSYDLTGSHSIVSSALNSAFGMSYSGVVAGTKTFFPDLPLNSGLYRVLRVDLGPEGTVVNAPYPTAVTLFNAGAYEKIMNSVFSMWTQVWRDRALACSYNLEYLLVGGEDKRTADADNFMWYDWMMGGWGARNGRDGFSATSPLFGAALELQPLEGQERLAPLLTTEHELIRDSGGPGQWRGGLGVRKGATLGNVGKTVMSYGCDRARSIAWGIEGGLPSLPQGVWLVSDHAVDEFLGAWFADRTVRSGETFYRPSAGGGGYGDPLKRAPELVCEDVTDDRVSIERAAKDYGVVIREIDARLATYEVDQDATTEKRREIAENRFSWLEADAEEIASRYRLGELDVLDLVRQYGVIVDWGTGELLSDTTRRNREVFLQRVTRTWRRYFA